MDARIPLVYLNKIFLRPISPFYLTEKIEKYINMADYSQLNLSPEGQGRVLPDGRSMCMSMVNIRLLGGIIIERALPASRAGADGTVQENRSTNCRHLWFPVVGGLFFLLLVSSLIFGPVAAQIPMAAFNANPTLSHASLIQFSNKV